MSHILFTGGLRKEIHYIKVGDEGGYEPTMVIFNNRRPGRSFMIPLGAMWKYVDPHQYKNDEVATAADRFDFEKIVIEASQILTGRYWITPTPQMKQEAAANLAVCTCADAFHRNSGIKLCTSYNIFKLMQMFEITPGPQAAAQILLWIQNELEDLKNAPENPEPEVMHCGGEATIRVDGEVMAVTDVMVSETDAVLEEHKV